MKQDKGSVEARQPPQPANPINNRITRKLEGGRPHKVYDYMFVQMSNEQFQKEYAGKKVIIKEDKLPKASIASPLKASPEKNSQFKMA